MVNGQINYRECDKFLNVKLVGKLDRYHKGLVSSCEKVGEGMDKASRESYSSLVNQITQQLASSITSTVRGEVIKPITDSAASMVNSHLELSKELSDKIVKAIDHVKLKAEAGKNQRVEEVPQKKRDVLNTADVAKKTAKSNAGGKFHTVKKGETVWGIARKLGFKDDTEFMASNPHLKKDGKGFVFIKAGDQLAIPDGAVVQPRVASETGVYGPNPMISENKDSIERQHMLQELENIDKIYQDSPEYNKVEKIANSIGKGMDKTWVYGKAITKVLVAVGPKRFANEFPKTAEMLVELGKSIGNGVDIVIDAIDSELGKVFGKEYADFKAGVSSIKYSENTPILVKDLTSLIAEAAAGKVLWKPLEEILAMKAVKKISSRVDVDSAVMKRADVYDGDIKSLSSMKNLKSDLLLEEQKSAAHALGIFDEKGLLKDSIAARSKLLISGKDIKNPEVIKRLTADGSNINDWGKFRTESLNGPRGKFDWHFYQNKITGKINSDIDYKPKSVGPQK